MRINISIDNKLLTDLDNYCEKYRYNRSEFISKAIREIVYTVTIAKTEFPLKSAGEIPQKIIKDEVKKDEAEIQKQEKLSKAREALSNITKNSKAPIFCPKHGGSRIGGEYTCGCKV